MNLEIADKVALVTGASSGIGRAVAIALAQEGAKVALSGRSVEALEHTRALMQVDDDSALIVAGDLTLEEQCISIVEQAYEHFGRLHILVNCAAETTPTGVLDVSRDLWQQLLTNMFFSIVSTCQAAVPKMQEQKWGRIINVSSSSVKNPSGAAPYDVAKSAIVSYSKDLAAEVAEHNILVNCVCPGSTLTPMWTEKVGPRVAEWMEVDLDTLLHDIAQEIALKRLGRPEEIASVIAFLASERSSFMTGSCVYVDGGQTSTPF